MKGLRAARLAKGLKQKDVAAATGIKPSEYSHYENLIREPRLDALVRFSDFLGVSIDYLIRGEEFIKPEE